MQRSATRFGLTDAEWQGAVSELKNAILNAAWDRRMTWYGEIAEQVEAVRLEPYSVLMNHLLGAIFQEEDDAERPLITSIVTHKYGDKEPGPGFYEMARQLGYQFDEPFVFWSTKVQEVFTTYRRPPRTRSSRQQPGPVAP